MNPIRSLITGACSPRICLGLLLIGIVQTTAAADLNIPSDGSDGELVITANTQIDLGLAVTGQWDANNSPNAGKGIYDPDKWAVVFKYSSVTINDGATVTFKNHPSRAPVVWLVQGDVTINGAVSVNGGGWVDPPGLAEPGPGGFRGGSGLYTAGVRAGAGFGPGGGGQVQSEGAGYAGSYGSQGNNGPLPYGNPSVIPLVGGSGGAGNNTREQGYAPNFGGGAGGGALAILAASRFLVNGSISANGGSASKYNNAWDGGGGSGGAIRLVCEELTGTGRVNALGGHSLIYPGGLGRICIERAVVEGDLTVYPDPRVVTIATGSTPLVWLPDNGPSVRVVSIGGNPAPADPRAGFGAVGADVVLPWVSATTVVIETTNVEQASVVTARYTPRANGNFLEAKAGVPEVISEDPLVLRWTANIAVQDGYGAIQVKVVRP